MDVPEIGAPLLLGPSFLVGSLKVRDYRLPVSHRDREKRQAADRQRREREKQRQRETLKVLTREYKRLNGAMIYNNVPFFREGGWKFHRASIFL